MSFVPADTAARPHSRRELMVFLALTFGFAWLLWGYWVIAMPPGGLVISPAFIVCAIIGGLAPSLAAIVVSLGREGFAGLSGLLASFRRPIGRLYVLFSLLVVPAATALSCGVQLLAGMPLRWPDSSLLAMALIWPVMAALGEEIGWRGFLLPRLAPALGLLPSAIFIGLVWGLWHLPADYVALKGYEGLFWLAFLINGPIVLTAHSIIMGWLWQRTGGSALAAILYHWSITASAIVAPIAPGQGWEAIWSACIGAGSIWCVAVAASIVSRTRLPRTAYQHG